MANTYTTRFNMTKPEVGADTNAWGGHLNADLDTIDSNMVSLLQTSTQTMAGALSLPANGLNVGSGQLVVSGGNVSSTGNWSSVNGVFTGSISVGGTATFGAASYSGAVTMATTLSVTGAVTFSNTLSVTGLVTASTAPTLGGHLTNKTYVDGKIATTVPSTRSVTAGTSLTGGGELSSDITMSVSTGGITATQLASNSVTTVKITDSNVTTAKIADANITPAKLSGAQTGSAPIYGVRAWGSITSLAVVNASGNISTVTRSSGDFTITFTTAMSDANYAVVATVAQNADAIIRVFNKTTTSCVVGIATNGGTSQNYAFDFMVMR